MQCTWDVNSSTFAFCLFSFVLSFFALSIALLKHSRLLPTAYCLCYALAPFRFQLFDFLLPSATALVLRSLTSDF